MTSRRLMTIYINATDNHITTMQKTTLKTEF